VVDLGRAARELMAEPAWSTSDRNAETVATTDRMRITLTAVKAGAELGSEMTDDTLAVHCLEGQVAVVIDAAEATLGPGQLATIEEPRGWRLTALADSLLLLTSALGSTGRS
jgi:quercetin dioxygenase-like cupin family protein